MILWCWLASICIMDIDWWSYLLIVFDIDGMILNWIVTAYYKMLTLYSLMLILIILINFVNFFIWKYDVDCYYGHWLILILWRWLILQMCSILLLWYSWLLWILIDTEFAMMIFVVNADFFWYHGIDWSHEHWLALILLWRLALLILIDFDWFWYCDMNYHLSCYININCHHRCWLTFIMKY